MQIYVESLIAKHMVVACGNILVQESYSLQFDGYLQKIGGKRMGNCKYIRLAWIRSADCFPETIMIIENDRKTSLVLFTIILDKLSLG